MNDIFVQEVMDKLRDACLVLELEGNSVWKSFIYDIEVVQRATIAQYKHEND